MIYPFSAIVAQEALKRALLLCAVNPTLGGVLIQGDKGTAKSTAARALADLLPPIERVRGSRFNCPPDALLDICEACQQPEVGLEEVPVPFVNLPLGTTEDRLLGSLDLEGVLVERKKKLQPGLLAAVHRGILYIDEVNLLPDHLVDVLLDVAAMGTNTVQREGMSVSHPSRFTLIGTMNPEEGSLRPQFLDRFGLMVPVSAPQQVAERTEVIRRRMAFEADPVAFSTHWEPAQRALRLQIRQARALLSEVRVSDAMLTLISQLCLEQHVSSLRADLVMYKTAVTLAALAGRMAVAEADVRQAADLVLAHRKRSRPPGSNAVAPNEQPDNRPPQATRPPATPDKKTESQDIDEENTPADGPQADDRSAPEKVFGIQETEAQAPVNPSVPSQWQALASGRRSVSPQSRRGPVVRTEPDRNPAELAVSATLQESLLRDPDLGSVTVDDLHQTVRKGKTGNLILFIVDASGSMGASRRMEAVKGSVLSLLADAYQRRDRVGVIAFRGVEAQVLLEPTQQLDRAEAAMRTLPTGGRTPLPHALQLTRDVLQKLPRANTLPPFLVILSDGKANVPLPGGGDAWAQSLSLAAELRQFQLPALVLDTDNAYLRFNRAAELARALGADCLTLEELSADALTRTVSGRIHRLT